MSRELRYLRIAAELRCQIIAGEIAPGTLLPSESELAGAHGASRVTVRKALAQLKHDGIVNSRQGFGWYAVGAPLRQSLRDLTTIEQQIRAAGRNPSRELLSFAFKPTPAPLVEVFDTDSVLEFSRIDRIDGQPFAIATVWVRADLAAGLSPLALEHRPLSDQLGVEFGGATQTITATSADDHHANLLTIPVGAPLLRVERTTRAADTRPVLRSLANYNPLLTELVADLPPAAHEAEPGLRLIHRAISADPHDSEGTFVKRGLESPQ